MSKSRRHNIWLATCQGRYVMPSAMVFSSGITTKAAASKRSTQRRIAKKLRDAA